VSKKRGNKAGSFARLASACLRCVHCKCAALVCWLKLKRNPSAGYIKTKATEVANGYVGVDIGF
jgi:hypothetical protein